MSLFFNLAITELHRCASTMRSRDSSMSDEIQCDIEQAKSFSSNALVLFPYVIV